ncbi:hypothetical protein GCK72_006272 [Caenorhabditis remanei]|uniref:Uncharacterized protein n=1 Tax=Caenorhabditis remanei TaxID=31234 RepID=A0A6A5HI16_CAERE|nr:hypothetical protein GCK72_006272 [Caenorhabditis remanei]KAF1766316.1 hypothetical protein GCK72_006272 [Caenorhabditis remanei]
MISHILTILIFTSAAVGAPHRYEKPQAQLPLRGEFVHFVKERIYHVIDSSNDAPPKYMMIYVTLTACHENRTSHRIISGHVQTTWEEETCGTEYMQKWCQENPGNLITVMTGVEKMNTSAMAQFRCKMSEADDEQSIIVENIETEWMKRIVPLMIVVFILAVIYNFRRACKEQEEKGKLANAIKIVVDNSMDTITLDSSRDEKTRKEYARFDDDSDPSLGTLFTL